MALVYVGGTTGKSAGGTANWTVSLTALTGGIASSPSIGDVVIVSSSAGYAAADPYYWVYPADYGPYGSGTSVGTTYRVTHVLSYKRLTAVDTVVTLPGSQDSRAAVAAAVQVWRGVDDVNPFDVVCTLTNGAASGRPDPGAVTPITDGAVIIATGSSASGTGAIFTSSDLSAFLSITSADTTDAMTGIGYKTWAGGAFDPAQFGGGTTGAGDAWFAAVTALLPKLPPVLAAAPKALTVAGSAATFKVTPIRFSAEPRDLVYAPQAAAFSVTKGPTKVFTEATPVAGALLGNLIFEVSTNGQTIVANSYTTHFVIFHRNGDTWTQEAKVAATIYAVLRPSISGDGNVVVLPLDAGLERYARNVNGTWTGVSVTLSGSRTALNRDGTLVFSVAPASGVINPLKAFTWNGSSYVESASIAGGSLSTINSQFGGSVRCSADGTVVVASDELTPFGVYEFLYTPGAPATLTQTAVIGSGVGSTYADSLMMDSAGSTVIGKGGTQLDTLTVYKKVSGTWTSLWFYVRSQISPVPSVHATACSIHADGNRIYAHIPGAYTTDTYGGVTNTGATYEFDWNGTTYTPNGKRYSPGPAYPGVRFSYLGGAACDGLAILGSAPYYSTGGAIMYFGEVPAVIAAAPAGIVLEGFPATMFKATSGAYLAADAASFLEVWSDAALTHVTATNKVLSAAPASVSLSGAKVIDNPRIGQLRIAYPAANLYQRKPTLNVGTFVRASPATDLGVYADAMAASIYVPANMTALTGYQFVALSPDGLLLFVKKLSAPPTFYPIEVYSISGDTLTLIDSIADPVGAGNGVNARWGEGAYAMSTDGAHLLVGAPDEQHATSGKDIGAIYYYARSGSNWNQQQRIQPSVLNDTVDDTEFGRSIAISGDGLRAAAGAPFYNNVTSVMGGAMFMMVRSGSTWTVSTVDTSNVQYDAMGEYLDLSTDGATVVYSSSHWSFVFPYTNFKVKKYSGGLWPTIALISGTENILSLAINSNGTTIVKTNVDASAYHFSRTGDTWAQTVSENNFVGQAAVFRSPVFSTDLVYQSHPNLLGYNHASCFAPEHARYSVQTEPAFVTDTETNIYGGASNGTNSLVVWAYNDSGSNTKRLLWRRRVATVRFRCDKAAFAIGRYSAGLGRKFNLPSGGFTLTPTANAMYKGKGFAAIPGALTVASPAVRLDYARRPFLAPKALVISSPVLYTLRTKGSIMSVPNTHVCSFPAVRLTRVIPISAAPTGATLTWYPAQVSRLFPLRPTPVEYTIDGERTVNSLSAGMLGTSITFQPYPAKAMHHRRFLAGPAAFTLGISYIAGRRPQLGGVISVGAPEPEAVQCAVHQEVVYVQRAPNGS